MKKTLLALAAIAASSAFADELLIDRSFSVNGRMHVFVNEADWTNKVGDYSLKQRVHGESEWNDAALGASNWWGPGGQPWNGFPCLVWDCRNCAGLMDFRLGKTGDGKVAEFTVDGRSPLAGTPICGLDSGNPAAQAFDSMINTYYLISTYTPTERWVGLDFGKKRYISRVSGIFNGGTVDIEVADRADFSDARTILSLDEDECSHDNFYEGFCDSPLGGRYVRAKSTYDSIWFSVWDIEFTEAISIVCNDPSSKLPTITIDPWFSRENGALLLRSTDEAGPFAAVHTFAAGETEWTDGTLPEISGTYYYRVVRLGSGGEPAVEPAGDAIPYVISSDVPILKSFAINGRLHLFIDNFTGNASSYMLQRYDPAAQEWIDYNVVLGNTDTSVAPLPFQNAQCLRGAAADLRGVNDFRVAFAGASEWTPFTVDARLPLSGTPYNNGSHRPAANAFDGMIDSYYLHNGAAADMWPGLDLGEVKNVATVAAIVNNSGAAVFEGSLDRDFSNPVVLRVLSAAECSSGVFFFDVLDAPAAVRYVRLRNPNEEGWYSVWEMEVGEGISVDRNAEKMPSVSIVSAYTESSGATLYRSTSENSGYEAVHVFAQGETSWTDNTCPATGTTYWYKVGESGLPVSVYHTFAPIVTRAFAFNGRANIWIEDYAGWNSENPAYVLQYRQTGSGVWTGCAKFSDGSNNYSVDHPFPTSLMSLGTSFSGLVEWRIRYAADDREWFYFTIDFKNPLKGEPWSDYGGVGNAAGALDGKVDSYCLMSANGDMTVMSTGVDFGESRTFSAVRWLSNGSHGTIEISDDGFATCETIYTLTGDDNLRELPRELVLDSPASARYLRFRAPPDEGQWYSIWEIEVDIAIAAENEDCESGCPTLIFDSRYSREGGAAIFRASRPDGLYARIGTAAAGTTRWTDTSLAVGETGYYKVAALDGTGEPGALSAECAKATRMARLDRNPADETALVNCSPVCDTDASAFSNPVANAFDGDLTTNPYADGRNPAIGLDFGRKPVVMKKLRIYCHDQPWYIYLWMRHLAVFGSNDEADPFGSNAVQISEELPGDVSADGGFYREWRDIDCTGETPYRYIFVKQVDDVYAGDPWRGAAAECRFYGWRGKSQGICIFLR